MGGSWENGQQNNNQYFSRDKKDDLFDISAELREELISIARFFFFHDSFISKDQLTHKKNREGTWPFHSNYLPCKVPGKSKQVTFCKKKKKWCVGGVPWETLRKK